MPAHPGTVNKARAAAPHRAAAAMQAHAHAHAQTQTQTLRREWRLPGMGRPAPQRASAACSCGGGCPRCKARDGQGDKADPAAHTARGPALSQPGDVHEREADAIAARIVAGGRAPGATPRGAGLQRAARADAPHAPHPPHPPHGLDGGGLRSPSQPLDAATRRFMEAGFGADFGAVRVHTGSEAARSAAGVGARAYTVGAHIVFGPGEYAPASRAGQRLLAHELAHVVQQSRGEGLFSLQRAPTISVVPADFVGPLSTTQRRAAASCPISCCFQRLGTLHAMPLASTRDRAAVVAAGDAAATGIGAQLHFMAESAQPAAGDGCHCDDFHMIQILTSTHPMDPRNRTDFVDNDPAGSQPFYGAPAGIGLSGHGEHAIPPGAHRPDAGERVTSTESIYDTPYRQTGWLANTSFSWMAETCVACVKNGAPDRVLGCVTYGFTRHYDAAARAFEPMVAVAPGCLSHPTQNFARTLRTDPTTTGYDFVIGPGFDNCPIGDFPTPRGDTRVA